MPSKPGQRVSESSQSKSLSSGNQTDSMLSWHKPLLITMTRSHSKLVVMSSWLSPHPYSPSVVLRPMSPLHPLRQLAVSRPMLPLHLLRPLLSQRPCSSSCQHPSVLPSLLALSRRTSSTQSLDLMALVYKLPADLEKHTKTRVSQGRRWVPWPNIVLVYNQSMFQPVLTYPMILDLMPYCPTFTRRSNWICCSG